MKCYLILRENVESGPFTLEEMQTKILLHTDLIWIEGSSQSWKFPLEISDLAPLVQATSQKDFETFSEQKEMFQQTDAKRIFVALPPQPVDEARHERYNMPLPQEQPALETGFVQPLETLKANLEAHKAGQFSIRSGRAVANWGWMAAVFAGLLGGTYMIKKMVDAMDDRAAHVATAALPATNRPLSSPEEDKTYRNALSTVIVPADTLVVEKPKEVKKVNIKKLVDLSASGYKKGVFGGFHNLKLLVDNKSEHILDKVTIEVRYLKPNGDVIHKETHTVLAVAPNSSKTLDVPSSNRGVDFKYRILSIKSHEAKVPMRYL